MGPRELSLVTEEDVMDMFRGETGLNGKVISMGSEPGIAAEVLAEGGIYRVTSSFRIHKTHGVVEITQEEAIEYEIREFLPWGADITVRKTKDGYYADVEKGSARFGVCADTPDLLVAYVKASSLAEGIL